MSLILITSVLAFASALVTSVFGFGAGLVLTPLLSLIMPLPQAIAIGAVIFLFTSGSKVFWFRRDIAAAILWRGTLLVLPGLFVGFALISWLSLRWLELGYGVLLLGFGFSLLCQGDTTQLRLPPSLYPPLAGVLSALIHGGGPLVFAYCRSRQLDRVGIVATMAGIHFCSNIVKGLFFGASGLIAGEQLLNLMPACAAAVVGTRIGRTLLQRYLNERLFAVGVGAILLLLATRYLLPDF